MLPDRQTDRVRETDRERDIKKRALSKGCVDAIEKLVLINNQNTFFQTYVEMVSFQVAILTVYVMEEKSQMMKMEWSCNSNNSVFTI